MLRDYEGGVVSAAPVLFIGSEVEHTKHHGKKTLFVVGEQSIDEIVGLLKEHGVRHVYLAANHSYDQMSDIDWVVYVAEVKVCAAAALGEVINVTLEVPVTRLSKYLVRTSRPTGVDFTLMVSVAIANIHENIVMKVDDIDFKATNPGVWCYQPVGSTVGFNDWSAYTQDKVIR